MVGRSGTGAGVNEWYNGLGKRSREEKGREGEQLLRVFLDRSQETHQAWLSEVTHTSAHWRPLFGASERR